MKISVSFSVFDFVETKKTFYEKIISLLDKKSANFKKYSHSEILNKLKSAGLEGIELLIPKSSEEIQINQTKKILDENSITVFSVHQSLSNKNNISIEEITSLCKNAEILSAKTIVLHTESLAKKLKNENFVNELKNLQKKYNIKFGIENMGKSFWMKNPFIYNIKELSLLMEKLGLDLTLDISHLGQAGYDPVKAYTDNHNRIINIHISDYKKNFIGTYFISQIGTHLPITKGILDIENFIKTLIKEKYEGTLTLEVHGNLEEIIESIRYIKSVN